MVRNDLVCQQVVGKELVEENVVGKDVVGKYAITKFENGNEMKVRETCWFNAFALPQKQAF